MDKSLHQVLDDLFHYLIIKSCQLVHNGPSIWTCVFPKIPLECIQIIHAWHMLIHSSLDFLKHLPSGNLT